MNFTDRMAKMFLAIFANNVLTEEQQDSFEYFLCKNLGVILELDVFDINVHTNGDLFLCYWGDDLLYIGRLVYNEEDVFCELEGNIQNEDEVIATVREKLWTDYDLEQGSWTKEDYPWFVKNFILSGENG